jgi:SAM-dependent methyltransferase
MDEKQAQSFGAVAELYDRIRPTYPAEALEWALAGAGTRVVDLGAGTGIMSRVLVGLGYDVVAVEPDALMRERLTAVSPTVTAHAGSAESIPLPDGSVDGVIAAQAYHWFDTTRALPEIARVLRPGGVFAAVWNDRDEATPWVHEYTYIIEGVAGDAATRSRRQRSGVDFGPLFTPVEVARFRHETTQTRDSLFGLMHSRSYYLTASPAVRRELDERVAQLIADNPDMRDRTEFQLPYVTSVFRAAKAGSSRR